MEETAPPRLGVVGCGIRGFLFATAIRQHPWAELVAVCDPDPEVRERAEAALGVPGYADAEAMLSVHPELTAAVIATPDFAHRDAAVGCLERGLDLMIEKPLATTVADADAIVAAAGATDPKIMIAFENRWNPRFAELRRQLAAGGAGTVVNQVINLNDTIFVPTSMLSWAARSSPAWFLMPHSLDLACWLSDSWPVSVFARGVKRVLPGLGVDTWDAITASFTMADGSVTVLNSQWVLPTSMPAVFDFRYELNTDTTSFRLNVSDSGVTRYDDAGGQWVQLGHPGDGQVRGVPVDMIGDFIAVLGGAERDVPGLQAGYLITAAIEAVHTSLATGLPQGI
ncbi:Gfo/Idh/MocA family protein [Microlunatus speluncae]|uniref:Gfo/Idh/MocA family protein n=1 Tax=Microlunatus speluncae TaxID=2594267 RepID=UPI0012666BA7|nr:Gfo/Idh/MocA family oxidoreductase [Microlunatus speluncae]